MVRRVTLTDISREAGVGAATVSRALGDHPDVSAATRERVREVAQRLGYRPSVTARALRSGGYQTISAIVPDAEWGWWEPVVRAAFEAAAEAGYQLMVHPVAGAKGGVVAVIDGLVNVPTEGVIVIGTPDQHAVRQACDRISFPAVAIDDTSRNIRLPTVSPRNRMGARELVQHLLSAGYRKIALGRPPTNGDPRWGEGLFIEERVAGYLDALEEAGISVAEDLIVGSADAWDESRALWPELDALITSGRRFDALFCIADLMAAPALRTLRAHGLRVPDDVAVAGFDDERAALLLDPQLTTSRQPYRAMGVTAVELLLRAIRGESVPIERHELETELIVRSST